ncbi:hypothetical protein K458DRAFT_485838 [Lentithecium fluviatile CBS 122367]|uniref:Ubiquitin 3 binding protein But2 C-terminal domain-containing protein n=1 Tax=Lentithecium fluviatile CBS 122367 TaxID=1168545 RepID=A0A6G1J7X3_9PLEO|nr:hypothetical protein K458DRAFT_485838 [Lentithecium fluviatile CBS 122367]
MLLSNLLVLFPLLASASPVAPRSCSIESPTFIGWIDSAQPDFNSNPLADNTLTLALKEPNRLVDTLIEFTVPAGAWGCQLELYFQKGYGGLYGYGGPIKADVWNVDKNVPLGPYNYSVNWNLAPKPTNLFGTTGTLVEPPRQGYQEDVKRVINSAACKGKMTYRARVPEEVQPRGGVQFYQRSSSPYSVFGGWRMVHNC